MALDGAGSCASSVWQPSYECDSVFFLWGANSAHSLPPSCPPGNVPVVRQRLNEVPNESRIFPLGINAPQRVTCPPPHCFLFVPALSLRKPHAGVTDTPDIFKPASTPANSIHQLSVFVLVIAGLIFLVVFSLLVYACIRRREVSPPRDGREPPQVYGSNPSDPACHLGQTGKPAADPYAGERHTQKVFGAVRLDDASFTYLHQQDYFQWETYLAFLEQVVVPAFYRRRRRIYLIQDNASYHKKQETYEWFKANRRYVEVFQLPPYWPELNATERIWNYTRKHVTHNQFF